MVKTKGPKADSNAVKPGLALLEPGAPLPWIYRGALTVMFVFLGLLALRQVGDPDAGFHLKAGTSILSGHGWPRTDSFTYTLSDHPYRDTSWGYQVLLVLSHSVAGAPGMVVFHLILLAALFLLIYKTARLASVDPATLVVLFGAGILASEVRYDIRPEALSYLFLAGLLYVLHRRALGWTAPLWVLPLLLWLWANCHALFVLGWAALACTVAGLWIRDRRPDKPLILWTGASLLTPFVNPYGMKGVMFPFSLLTRFQGGNAFGGSIGEFTSPFALHLTPQNPFYAHWPIWTFRVLVILAGTAFVVLLGKRKYWAALVILIFLPLEAGMIRNMPLLAATALPAMIWALPVSGLRRISGLGEPGARFARGALAGAAVGMALMLGMRILTGAYYGSMRRSERFGWTWSRVELPFDAADYVKRAGLNGPMFNHLNFGGALMWALPQRVFIDGRLEMTGEDFYQRYREALISTEALERLAAEYGFQWIIFPYTAEPDFLSRLSADPHWRLGYVDGLAAVFVREGPDAQRLVDRISTGRRPPVTDGLETLPGIGGPARASPLLRWLSGLVLSTPYPWDLKDLGMFYYFRNDFARAEAWFRAALAAGGAEYDELYLNLGSALLLQQKYDEAAACYEVVLQEDPENRIALAGMDAAARERSRKP